jgi:hypothetical protein
MWKHILRDQLQVSEDEFWRCVREGVSPSRGAPAPTVGAFPAELVHLLVHRVGVAEREVMMMTKGEAVARLNDYWAG